MLSRIRFDPARDPRQWSLTFSLGDHFCLGQALARCELQEALATLVATCDDLELLAEPRWTPRVTVHRMEALPLRFAPRTPA